MTEKIKETKTFIIKRLFSCNKRLDVSVDQRTQKVLNCTKGWTIRKLMGWGGGEGRSTKKYFRKGKLNEKNSCMPINPRKYSCYGLKNSCKEFENEKKFLWLANSPPPPP